MGDDYADTFYRGGICQCRYSVVILSEDTRKSPCQLKELQIIEELHDRGLMTVFPLLYEIDADKLPDRLIWMRKLIFREVSRSSGTREVCNHIACRLAEDIVDECSCPSLNELSSGTIDTVPPATAAIIDAYLEMDPGNINGRISMLYAAFLSLMVNKPDKLSHAFPSKLFGRLFNETKLNLEMDYRETWLAENALRIAILQTMRSNQHRQG